jgi:hypothetical protein
MILESIALFGFCFIVWIVWIPAVLIQKRAKGDTGGTSILPIIPLFPIVAGIIGYGLNLWIPHLGSWMVGGAHVVLLLSFGFTITRDLIKIKGIEPAGASNAATRRG